jgi:hypothetical protein
MSPFETNAAVDRARAEFIEMPGLRLSVRQAARLWGLDQSGCKKVIDALVHRAFLRWTSTGLVVRTEDAR